MVANDETEVIMPETINSETGEITPELRPIRNANPWTRVRVAKHPVGPSLAKQSFKDECDINYIMRKFEKKGVIDHLNNHQGQYGNFIGFEDYHISQNKILAAAEAFASIPSKIRAKFGNDPATFLEFAQNPENLDEMIKIGLAPQKAQEPQPETSPEPGAPTKEETQEAAVAASKAASAA